MGVGVKEELELGLVPLPRPILEFVLRHTVAPCRLAPFLLEGLELLLSGPLTLGLLVGSLFGGLLLGDLAGNLEAVLWSVLRQLRLLDLWFE